ncbi:MAG: hypothetical protein AB9872_04060 [Solidesulfovibrio sp.]
MAINVKPADWVVPFLDKLRGHFSEAEKLGVPASYVQEVFELFKKVLGNRGGLREFPLEFKNTVCGDSEPA